MPRFPETAPTVFAAVAALCFGLAARAQVVTPLFTPPNAAPGPQTCVRSTDFNGDGQLDFFDYLDFVASLADAPVSAAKSANLLSFVAAFDAEQATWVCQIDAPPGTAPGVIIPHASLERPTALALEDVNADGRADLCSVRFNAADIRIQLPDGTFAAPAPIAGLFENNLSTSNFQFIDVAGSARPDLVWVASQFSPPPAPPNVQIQILVNDDSGGFLPPVNTAIPGGTLGAASVAPQSAAGPPIIAAVRSSGISIFRVVGTSVQLVNPVDGTLLPPGTNSSSGTVPFVSGLREAHLQDLNGDGIPELITTNYTDVLFRPGIGNGTFGPITALSGVTGTNSLTTADLNSDGQREILSVNFNQETLNIWRATGPYTYAPRLDLPTGVNPAGIIVEREAIPAGSRVSALHILNTNDAMFTAYPVLPDGTVIAPQRLNGPSGTTDAAAGDFNGDGYTDVAASGSLGRVSVYLNNGDGSGTLAGFTPADGENQAGTNIKALVPVTGDTPTLVGRDRLALAITDRFATAFYKPEGPEGNRIDIEQLVVCPSTITTLGTADINSDARTDIISLYPGAAPAAQAWIQSGTGTFPSPVNLNSSASGWNLVIENHAGSGLPQSWVMLHDFESGVTEVHNFTGGAFTFVMSIASGGPSVSARIGDIDGDGVDELIAAHPGSGAGSRRISVVTGLTSGSPSAPAYFDLPRNPTDITAADFDLDGDTDVLVTTAGSINTNQSAMFVPNDSGTLNPGGIQFFSVGGQPRELLAIDLHAPRVHRGASASAPELIAAEFDPPTQDRVGGITVVPNLATAPPPACVGDINGDGVVNTADLTLLLLRFGQTVEPGSPGASADLNGDGSVNTVDLTLMLVRFGQSCR